MNTQDIWTHDTIVVLDSLDQIALLKTISSHPEDYPKSITSILNAQSYYSVLLIQGIWEVLKFVTVDSDALSYIKQNVLWERHDIWSAQKNNDDLLLYAERYVLHIPENDIPLLIKGVQKCWLEQPLMSWDVKNQESRDMFIIIVNALKKIYKTIVFALEFQLDLYKAIACLLEDTIMLMEEKLFNVQENSIRNELILKRSSELKGSYSLLYSVYLEHFLHGTLDLWSDIPQPEEIELTL